MDAIVSRKTNTWNNKNMCVIKELGEFITYLSLKLLIHVISLLCNRYVNEEQLFHFLKNKRVISKLDGNMIDHSAEISQNYKLTSDQDTALGKIEVKYDHLIIDNEQLLLCLNLLQNESINGKQIFEEPAENGNQIKCRKEFDSDHNKPLIDLDVYSEKGYVSKEDQQDSGLDNNRKTPDTGSIDKQPMSRNNSTANRINIDRYQNNMNTNNVIQMFQLYPNGVPFMVYFRYVNWYPWSNTEEVQTETLSGGNKPSIWMVTAAVFSAAIGRTVTVDELRYSLIHPEDSRMFLAIPCLNGSYIHSKDLSAKDYKRRRK